MQTNEVLLDNFPLLTEVEETSSQPSGPLEVQDPTTCEVYFHSKRSRKIPETTTGTEVGSYHMACSRSSSSRSSIPKEK